MNIFDYFFQETKDLSKDIVLGPREQISYKTLYRNCLNISNEIVKNYGENNNILILSENSVFFITAYLAILKSGNTCVPLNPNIEKENFENILSRTESQVVFVSKRFEKKYSEYQLEIVGDEKVNNWIESGKGINNSKTTDSFDENRLAEIIFTSGSTGEQKGVMITHKNIIANTTSIIEYLKLTSSDIIQVVMPFYYCYGLSLLHTHLRVGGSVVLNNSFIFLGSVINDLKKYECTGFAGVPSHFQILLRKTKDFKNTKFPALKYVTQAGGKLHNAFIEEFMDAFPEIDFFVMYGQTEATARLSYLPPYLLKDKMGSMGKGIPGVQLRVVDENGNNVKPGETGEIIAKGDNIMPGYFKDKESTDEVLHNGWLQTGDMATVDEDGYIFIKSRKKEIIKVRGIRISPKEIEEVIVTFPGVVDCTIEAETDEITGESLKAIVYINDSDKGNFTDDLIKNHCAQNLTPYKIPQKVIFETKLTFNAAGKKTK
ncbi:MAG: AMP-dependent synthetase [Bacteroidetes bacterium 4484_249]|nr:MAG: AMP-dependent synthetase [Bacteroidetes bacterium 4484_249]